MKITEIYETRNTTREKRNELGELERSQEPIKIKRKVKTVQGGARFGHYLLDVLVITAIIFVLIAIGIMDERDFTTGGRNGGFQVNYSAYFIMLLYYAATEFFMGRTIGKMATKSFVIDEYARKPEIGVVLLRNLIRLVPFEAFSCLGERGWHDKWSNTWVVTEEEWIYLKKAIGQEELLDDDILDDVL